MKEKIPSAIREKKTKIRGGLAVLAGLLGVAALDGYVHRPDGGVPHKPGLIYNLVDDAEFVQKKLGIR